MIHEWKKIKNEQSSTEWFYIQLLLQEKKYVYAKEACGRNSKVFSEHQHIFTRTLTHSHTCTPVLKHQENNLQFKGLTWIRGHILSLSSQRRSSLTPLKKSRISWWGVLRVKRRPCVTRTILPVYVCLCVRGWTSASSISFPHPGSFHHGTGVFFVSPHATK